jgi:DNA end-binding protein Ku
MLDLAVHIVETKAGHFEPERFTDHYEDALKLIKKKQRGEKIERPKKHPQAQVINLMEALRQTAAAERGGAYSHPRRTPTRTPANPPSTRPRKAG